MEDLINIEISPDDVASSFSRLGFDKINLKDVVFVRIIYYLRHQFCCIHCLSFLQPYVYFGMVICLS